MKVSIHNSAGAPGLLVIAAIYLFTIASAAPQAQGNYGEIISQQPPSPTIITPEMAASASSVSSAFAAQFTGPVQEQGSAAGDVAFSGDGSAGDTEGAGGQDTGSFQISKGGIIAIAVVVGFVVLFGITSTVLWYLAKKRSWEIKATIRRSAKRVATALTPRRTTFGKDALQIPKSARSKRDSRGMTKLEDVPPTPGLTTYDLEKANAKADEIELKNTGKFSRWARKAQR